MSAVDSPPVWVRSEVTSRKWVLVGRVVGWVHGLGTWVGGLVGYVCGVQTGGYMYAAMSGYRRNVVPVVRGGAWGGVLKKNPYLPYSRRRSPNVEGYGGCTPVSGSAPR